MTHRVAVIPFGLGLGDTVNMRPLLHAIMRARPESRISTLCPAAFRSLLPGEVDVVDAIHGVPLWQRPARDSLLALALQKASARTAAPLMRRIDTLRWSAKLSILLMAQGFDEVINCLQAFATLNIDDRWSPGPWSRQGPHLIDEMAAFLKGLEIDVSPEERKPTLSCPPGSKGHCGRIVLNPNAGSTLKEASDDLWVSIARDLVEHDHAPLVLLDRGSGRSEEICRRAPGTQTVSTPTVPDLIDLVSCSDLLISPDTGVLHVAAALDIPYIGLFGSTDPHFLGPYGALPHETVLSRAPHAELCRGCWAAQLLPRAACALEYKPNCLSHIDSEDVLERVHARLAGPLHGSDVWETYVEMR